MNIFINRFAKHDDSSLQNPLLQDFVYCLVLFCAIAPAVLFLIFWVVKFIALLRPDLLVFRIIAAGSMNTDMKFLPYLGPIGVLLAPITRDVNWQLKACLLVCSVFVLLAGYSVSYRLGFL